MSPLSCKITFLRLFLKTCTTFDFKYLMSSCKLFQTLGAGHVTKILIWNQTGDPETLWWISISYIKPDPFPVLCLFASSTPAVKNFPPCSAKKKLEPHSVG